MVKLRLALADDHALLRAGLALLIDGQEDMTVVAQAGTHSDAIAVVERTLPDVLVLDLSMPDGTSGKTIEAVRRRSPQTKILVVTTHDEPAYLRSMLAAGCAGYLVKTATDAEMLSAIRTVAQGRLAINLSLTPDEMQTVLGTATRKNTQQSRASLSEREQEVLVLLARGYTNQQVADKLFLSVKTIETYRSRIGEKLGLRDRSELVTYAMNLGLLGKGETPER